MTILSTKLSRIVKEAINKHPRGFYVLFYTEMWELFGRFGFIALLVLYMTKTLHLSDTRAFTTYSAFIALIYVTPLLGGYLADRYLGLKRSVLIGAAIMMLGNSLLVIPNLMMVYLGLAIVAVGSGFFTPTLAALLSKLYEKREQERDAGFVLYYISRNIGALLAPILCGIVGQQFGYNYAFMLSALGMLSGFVVFSFGHKYLPDSNEKPHNNKRDQPSKKIASLSYSKSKLFTGAIIVLMIPITAIILFEQLDGYLLLVAGIISLIVLCNLLLRGNAKQGYKLLLILSTMLIAVIFSALLNQGGTTLSLFIDRIVDRQLLGMEIPTSLFFALDPIFMILFGAVVVKLAKKIQKPNYEAAAMLKFAIGMFILGVGFLIFVAASQQAIASGAASPLYVLFAYSIFPVAELCIMPIAMSMITRLAPKGLESTIVGIYMLGLASASYFTGVISKLGNIKFSLTNVAAHQHAAHIYSYVFTLSAVILMVATVMLLLFSLKLRGGAKSNRGNQLQSDLV